MDGQRRFAVIGTDARLAAAGRALARAGFAVGGPEQTALADYILLPLPLDESRTPLAELLRAARPGALALGGKLSAQAQYGDDCIKIKVDAFNHMIGSKAVDCCER